MYHHLYYLQKPQHAVNRYSDASSYNYGLHLNTQSNYLFSHASSVPVAPIYHGPPNYAVPSILLAAPVQKLPLSFKHDRQEHVDLNAEQNNKTVIPDSASDYLVMSILAHSNALKKAKQLCEQSERKIKDEIGKSECFAFIPVVQSKIGLIKQRLEKTQADIIVLEKKYQVQSNVLNNAALTDINLHYKKELAAHQAMVEQINAYCQLNVQKLNIKTVVSINYWCSRVGYLFLQFKRVSLIPKRDGFLIPTGGPLSKRKNSYSSSLIESWSPTASVDLKLPKKRKIKEQQLLVTR